MKPYAWILAGLVVLMPGLVLGDGPGMVRTATNSFSASAPYQESFERYRDQFQFSSRRGGGFGNYFGWYSGGTNTDAYVTHIDPEYAWGDNTPLPHASHTMALYVSGWLTNRFAKDPSQSKVFIDLMVQPLRSYEPELTVYPQIDGDGIAFYFNSNGCLVVWHAVARGSGWRNVWTTLDHWPIEKDAWARLTVQMDYDTKGAHGANSFRVRLNEATEIFSERAKSLPLGQGENGGTHFAVGRRTGAPNPWLSSIAIMGDRTLIDDLVVRVDDPMPVARDRYLTVMNSNPDFGTIIGATNVASGGKRTFRFYPAKGYGVYRVDVNGALTPQGPLQATFSNVVDSSQALAVSFGPSLTAVKRSHPSTIAANHGGIRPTPDLRKFARESDARDTLSFAFADPRDTGSRVPVWTTPANRTDSLYDPETMSFTLAYPLYAEVTNTIWAAPGYHIVAVTTNHVPIREDGVEVEFGPFSVNATNYNLVWKNFDVWGPGTASVLEAVFDINARNLTLISPYGRAAATVNALWHPRRQARGATYIAPASPFTRAFDWDTRLQAGILDSPIETRDGGSQYVVVGWSATGNAQLGAGPGYQNIPERNSGTVTHTSLGAQTPPFDLTDDTTVSFHWATNHLLSVARNGVGTLTMRNTAGLPVANGWVAQDQVIKIQASPMSDFQAWEGPTNGIVFTEEAAGSSIFNIAIVPMTQARRLTAHFHNKTLRVTSAYGGEHPGTLNIPGNQEVTQAVTNSPIVHAENVKYTATGWVGTGNVTSGHGTRTGPIRLTQDSTLHWRWSTQYWFAVQSEGNGTVAFAASGIDGPAATEAADWVALNTPLSVTAEPAESHLFMHWRGDLNDPDDATNLTVTVTMDRKRSLTAHFVPEPRSLAITSAWGSVRLDGVPITTPANRSYPFGTRLAQGIEVAPPALRAGDNGRTQYVVVGWTASGSAPAPSTAISAPDPYWATSHVAIAPFVILEDTAIAWNWRTNVWLDIRKNGWDGTFTVATPTSVLAQGTTACASWVALDSVIELTAKPLGAFAFRTWLGDTNGIADPTQTTVTVTMDQARALVADFDSHTLDIVSEYGQIYLNTDEIFAGPINQPASYATNFSYRQNFKIEIWTPSIAIGATQYVAQGWIGTGNVPAAGVPYNPGVAYDWQLDTIANQKLTQDSTVVWLWATNYHLHTLTAGGDGYVTVTKLKSAATLAGDFVANNQGVNTWVGKDSLVRITPIPGAGNLFDRWSGDVPDGMEQQQPLEITIDQARRIEAHFKEQASLPDNLESNVSALKTQQAALPLTARLLFGLPRADQGAVRAPRQPGPRVPIPNEVPEVAYPRSDTLKRNSVEYGPPR